jgi:probable phosphoglycerate mutase
MQTTLYLVRHGETVDNACQIMQGQTQGELTPEGIRQAESLARELSEVPIDTFIASDLKRSVDTCVILASPHDKPVVQTPLLRERDWGSFTGRFIPDLKGEAWPDDIETLEALQQRARQFLSFVQSRYAGQCVLAVGHGIINKAIQAVHFHKTMQQVERMSNCEVRLLKF